MKSFMCAVYCNIKFVCQYYYRKTVLSKSILKNSYYKEKGILIRGDF